MTWKRRLAGIASLLVLAYLGWHVAKFALPKDKVVFDKYLTGLGPRLWTTWWYLATFLLSAFAFGQFLVRRLSKNSPRDGSWALAFSSGAIVFACTIGAFGWLRLLAYPFFWVLPLSMTLIGLPSLYDALLETHARWKAAPAFTVIELVVLLFGGLCLGLLVLQVINPTNVNYDAMWYHLRSAERYAMAGAILPTPEGDTLLTLPSCTSWMYTWAFLAPGLVLDDQIVLAQHLELTIFIGTMALIPPLVRTLIPGTDRFASRTAWIALFFFPSVFIYDTGLMGGADHFVALWSASVVLTWLQARERNDGLSWALLGIQLAGLTAKYSAMFLIVPLLPVMFGDALLRDRATVSVARRLQGLTTAGIVALVLTAPYWLRNWFWHHNPVYPLASSIFPSTPWEQDASAWSYFASQSDLSRSTVMSPAGRLEGGLRAMWDYHEKLYGWPDMMGHASVMGSGYFLSLGVIPFLPERRRLIGLAVLLNLGVFLWFNTHLHHLRYLTVLTPLMAAGMAAVVLSLWKLGWPARVAVLGVTGLLLTAYADIPFRHTHRMARGASTVENADNYISKRGPGNPRIANMGDISNALPPNAKPLVHGADPPLGIRRQTVADCIGLQYGIDYGRWGSVAEVWSRLRKMGVTHLLWTDEVEQSDSVAGEALFQALAQKTERKAMHGVNIGELPADAPPPEPGTHILYVGCTQMWRTAIYPVAVLAHPMLPSDDEYPELKPSEPVLNENWVVASADPRVGWVVQESACNLPPPPGYIVAGRARGSPQLLKYFIRQR